MFLGPNELHSELGLSQDHVSRLPLMPYQSNGAGNDDTSLQQCHERLTAPVSNLSGAQLLEHMVTVPSGEGLGHDYSHICNGAAASRLIVWVPPSVKGFQA